MEFEWVIGKAIILNTFRNFLRQTIKNLYTIKMDRWIGRAAIVTGANSGIGASIAEELTKAGMNVFALDMRTDNLTENAKKLSGAKGTMYPFKCDIINEDDILAAFKYVKEKCGGADVLVNNAGVMRPGNLLDGKTEDWKTVLHTNVIGYCVCTREAVKSMRERGVNDGHIINMNSIGGHKIIKVTETWTPDVYNASKFGVTAITEAARHQLRDAKTNIRITSISPGSVVTELSRGRGPEEELRRAIKDIPKLQPIDIANGLLYVLGTPPHVQVQELTIIPTGQTY